jgi:tRNA A-37 threonylcarbamoyl transferase component Bud32/streptogramin lyase
MLDNKYQIEAIIGQGGFGFVYRARERLTGETVAIKELVPSFVRDQQMVRRFIQEARATLRLTHPCIARTHTIFADRGTYYLCMEYLSGGSLADRLQGGPLAVEEAVRIARTLCQALAHAHQEGVVHCDIKPANVLFDARGRPRLADFGIAHVSSQLMTRQFFTSTGVTMGTVRYMAPEQLEGVRDDPRIDVYAVGALLYEMLAGRPYLDFEEATTPAAQMRNMQRIQSTPPAPLRALNPSVPEDVARAVVRALRKAPAERFGSARTLAQALQAPVPPTAYHRRARPTAAPTRVAKERGPSPPARAAAGGAGPSIGPRDEGPDEAVVQESADASPGRIRQVERQPVIPRDILDDASDRLVAIWQSVPVWTWVLLAVTLVALIVGGVGLVAGLVGPAEWGTTSPPPATAISGGGAGEAVAGPPLIYFVSNQDGKREIYRLHSEGRRVRVTNHRRGESWSPALGPGGTVHFTSNRDGKREIYRLGPDGSAVRVTNDPGGESWSPALAPDGTLYFTSNRDGKREIYRLGPGGSAVRVTNDPDGESWSPALALDGTLYFTSNRDGKREVYRLTSDAGTVRVTNDPDGESWSAALAPDGTLYFTSDRDGKRDIYRLDASGNTVRVTNDPDGESWSTGFGSDGTLYFTSNRHGHAEIYRLTAQADTVQVTDTADGDSWLSGLD